MEKKEQQKLCFFFFSFCVWLFEYISRLECRSAGRGACVRVAFPSFPSPFFHYCWMERRNVTHYRTNCSLFCIVTTTTSTRRRRIFLNEKLDKLCDRLMAHFAFSIGEKKEEEGKKENILDAKTGQSAREAAVGRKEREREGRVLLFLSLKHIS